MKKANARTSRKSVAAKTLNGKRGRSAPRKPPTKAAISAGSGTTSAKATAGRRDESRRVSDESQSGGDWRVTLLSEVRRLIQSADPEIIEERKWFKPTNPQGVPVWSKGGIVCSGETYKEVVKLTFARGASVPDPDGLFNSSLDGRTRRAIDFRKGDRIPVKSLTRLIRAAVAANHQSKDSASGTASTKRTATGSATIKSIRTKRQTGTKVVLLSGGNPQIAKAEGDAPVQAYLAAMPGWKSQLGRQLDALIVRHVPEVQKAVKWNSPFYGIEGQGWFVSFHVFSRYVKVTFFRGTLLRPQPPGHTDRTKEARWIDLYEGDQLDETRFVSWLKQAAAMPGWLA